MGTLLDDIMATVNAASPGLLTALLAGLSLAGLCEGHGHMTLPPSRNGGRLEKAADCLHGECMWFSQPDADYIHKTDPIARIPGDPTLNHLPFRTYNVNVSGGPTDYTSTSPWRAPGSAPVLGSGCGRAGGGPLAFANGGTAPKGVQQGDDGLNQPESEPTVW